MVTGSRCGAGLAAGAGSHPAHPHLHLTQSEMGVAAGQHELNRHIAAHHTQGVGAGGAGDARQAGPVQRQV